MRLSLPKATAALLLLTFMALSSSVDAMQLPPSVYSWNETLGEPALMDSYSANWALACPFRFKSGRQRNQPIWTAVSVPYGQPQVGDENPHAGMEFVFGAPGAPVYAVAPGTILSVSVETNGSHTVVQDVDFNGDGTPEGVKVEYRHLDLKKGRRRPEKGQVVTPATVLGIVGVADDGQYKLHLAPIGYQKTYDHEGTLLPYSFYDDVSGWNSGADVSFLKDSWHLTTDRGKVYVRAYGIGPGGAHVLPSEVVVFHDHFEGGWSWPYFHESPMVYVGDETYMFDFMTYVHEPHGGGYCAGQDGALYYPPDGGVAKYVIRLRHDYSVDPNAYEWVFTPMAYERPYENPNQWDRQVWYCDIDLGHTVYTWGQNLPFKAPEEGQWFSQVTPRPVGLESYCWNDRYLESVFYPLIEGEEGTANSPLEWNKYIPGRADEDPYENPDPAVEHLDCGIINKWGCVVTSWAIVLSNLGVTTPQSHPDLRLGGWSGPMRPDPFTVTLANTEWAPISWNGNARRYESLWFDLADTTRPPVYVHPDRVSTGFGVRYGRITWASTSLVESVTAESDTAVVDLRPGSAVFPAKRPFMMTVDGEVIQVQSVTCFDNKAVLGVARGQQGTLASAHEATAVIYVGTAEEKAKTLHDLLKTHKEGVIVRFPGHSMVFYRSLLDDTDFPGVSGLSASSTQLDPTQQQRVDDEWWDLFVASAFTPEDVATAAEALPPTLYEQGFVVADPGTQYVTGGFTTFSESFSFTARDRRLEQVTDVTWVIR